MKGFGASSLAVPVAVLIALVVAAATYWVLGAITSPGAFKARLATITSLARAQRSTMTAAPRFPVGSVCQTSLVRAATTVQNSLASKAANAGLTVAKATVVAGGAAAGREIGALDVDLEATGDYAAVAGLFESLRESRPMVFVDTVDIQPAAGAVTLKLSGQVYCWISVRR